MESLYQIARKANIKQVEEELMACRRPVRIERRKEDEEWWRKRDERKGIMLVFH
ncbi:MAG: hypothetical protein WAV32_05690 [Halobacteriota archaeon]